jgi:hypothetical protein
MVAQQRVGTHEFRAGAVEGVVGVHAKVVAGEVVGGHVWVFGCGLKKPKGSRNGREPNPL